MKTLTELKAELTMKEIDIRCMMSRSRSERRGDTTFVERLHKLISRVIELRHQIEDIEEGRTQA